MKVLTDFRSESGNKYFYNARLNNMIFCHPVLDYIIELKRAGINVNDFIKSCPSNEIYIESKNKYYPKETFKYYYQKYSFLEKNGFLCKDELKRDLTKKVTPEGILRSIANTRQITFEVTDFCNLACLYCGYGKFYDNYDKRNNSLLSFKKAKTILDYLAKFWNSSLNESHNKKIYISFYGGEPLLNFNLIKKIVDYVKGLDVLHNKFIFSLTTNGILLKKFIEYLVQNQFNIMISLDGDKQNNVYRVFKSGKPSFDVVFNNILHIKNQYPTYFKNNISVNAVLHNKNSVSEIYDFFKLKFGMTPNIGELNTSGIKSSQKKAFIETYSNINESFNKSGNCVSLEKELFVNIPSVYSLGIFLYKFSGCIYVDFNHLLSSEESMREVITGTCYPFSKKVFVTATGKILACERIGHQFTLGKVSDERVELDINNVADKYNKYFDKLRDKCNVCYNYKTCGQCIFHMDMDAVNPVCESFLNHDNFKKYLSKNISSFERNRAIYFKLLKEVVFE